MELNADGTLSLPAQTLNAQQLDQLLRELAKARAAMQPPVPDGFDPKSSETLLVQPEPAFAVSRAELGRINLFFRHQGFGWLAFLLLPEVAAQLQAFLAKRTAGHPVDFVTEEKPGGDQVH